MFGFSKSRIIVYLKIIHKACLEHRFTHTLIIWDIFKVFLGGDLDFPSSTLHEKNEGNPISSSSRMQSKRGLHFCMCFGQGRGEKWPIDGGLN